MIQKTAVTILRGLIISVGKEFDSRKILAKLRVNRYEGIGKYFRISLLAALPEVELLSGKCRDNASTDCIVYGELKNGVYLVQFSGGKALHIMLFGRYNLDPELMWVGDVNGAQLVRYLPHAEGGIYPHCSDPVRSTAFGELLAQYEPRPQNLRKHKLLVSALAA